MISTADYKQKATYWGNPSQSAQGAFTFDAPVVLDVRWENRQERFVNISGQEEVSRAKVWTKQDLDLDGYLFLGESAGTDPTVIDGAFPIRQVMEIPDLQLVFIERTAFL